MADRLNRLRRWRRELSRGSTLDARHGERGRAAPLVIIEPLEPRLLLSITAMIDYSYDTNNFFDTQAKKDLLELAVDMVITRFEDDLDAITPSGSNHWSAGFFDPATGTYDTYEDDLVVPADTIIIFAGGRDLGGSTLGVGGPGGYSASGNASWFTTLRSRGEAGAASTDPTMRTDFGPWGGSISFDSVGTTWHFGETTTGLSGKSDFLSVAIHETMHMLGFGTADSWDNLVDDVNYKFDGPASIAAYDGTGSPPLDPPDPPNPGLAHWANGTTDGGQEVAMDPSITVGTRKLPTELDFAGLDDLGWDVSGNHRPTADADSYSVDEDTTLNVVVGSGVLANDDDLDGDTITAVLVSGVSHGSLTLNDDGSFSYTPTGNYNGTDTFTYKANDGTDDSKNATVTITINAVNDAPSATGDSYMVDEDGTLNGSTVLTNDTDVDGDDLTAVLVGDVSHGSLTLNSDGTFTYTPTGDYNGTDSFTYKANDGTTNSGTVTVNITVNSVNDAPVATGDSYMVDEDNTLNGSTVLTNDSDLHGGAPDENNTPLTATLVDNVSHGSLTFNSNGTFTYTPTGNYNGSDSFTYRAVDSKSGQSAVTTVNITVNAVNDAPVATGDGYMVDEDNTLTVMAAGGVLNNDTDVDGDDLTAVLVDDVSHGSLTLNDDGSFTYTPTGNYNGEDSFTYKANDGTADSSTVTVSLTVNSVNDAPVATGDSYMVDEDNTLNGTTVLANDTDVESDVLSALLVTDVSHGSLTLNSDGTFTYTPAGNYNGDDSFTYKANDGADDSNTVTVSITVNAINDAPVATADSYMVDEDGTLNGTSVLGNDTDVEGDTLSAVLVDDVSHGSLTLNSDGTFTYTPTDNYNGSDSFTYKANDGADDSNTVTVS
ncbi:MAG: tandem-95 repeat protein, partial [Phycisphaera sp.]|nr:tandem-95 repeat protein [Phycisphaera sp.]